jgi:hypothetical protein
LAIGYDLLIYHDFSDTFDTQIQVGDSARVLGFEDLHVVALGPPIHEGKDRTLVLAHGARPNAGDPGTSHARGWDRVRSATSLGSMVPSQRFGSQAAHWMRRSEG